jgi:hypothetical protein
VKIDGQKKTEKSADHEQIAMSEIDHRQNAVDHGVAQRDQRVDTAKLQGVEGLLEYIDHRIVHTIVNQSAIFVGFVVSVLNVLTYV